MFKIKQRISDSIFLFVSIGASGTVDNTFGRRLHALGQFASAPLNGTVPDGGVQAYRAHFIVFIK